jgi:hypothetical protein
MYLHSQQSRLGEIRKAVYRRPRAAVRRAAAGTMAGFSEPQGPIFDFPPPCAECTLLTPAQCRTALRAAIIEAIRLARNAAEKIEQILPLQRNSRDQQGRETARLFTAFFGHDPLHPVPWAGNEASGVSVAKRFRAVERELNGGRRVTFRCRPTRVGCGEDLTCCDTEDVAWVHPDIPNTVNLCDQFWATPANLRGLPPRNFRASAIIHEMLHLLFEDIRDCRPGRPKAVCYQSFALRLAGFGADPVAAADCTQNTPCP